MRQWYRRTDIAAYGVGPGDAVFCPSFTFCATVEVIAHLGATPVFVDIDRDTYNMDAESLRLAISDIKSQGTLTPRAIIAVDLFGQCADYPAIAPIAKAHGLKLIADSAQGFGTILGGCCHNEFFPGQAAGVLRRWRGGANR